MPIDQQLLLVLKSLKAAHKKWLLESNVFPEMLSTDDQKLEHLACIWGANELARYDGLYREGHGKLFTWWLPKTEGPDLDTIFKDLINHQKGVVAGLKPVLHYGAGPALHKAERWADRIELQYAVAQKPRIILDGWDERVIEPIRIYRVFVKQSPFTIEMRAVPQSSQTEILRLMSADLMLDFGAITPCLLVGDTVEENLRESVNGLYFGVHQVGNGNAHLDYTIIKTDRTVSILDQDDFKEQLMHEGRREYLKRFYLFNVKHDDGYIEQCLYIVKVPTGELTIGKGISEFSADKLRSHVVALFQS